MITLGTCTPTLDSRIFNVTDVNGNSRSVYYDPCSCVRAFLYPLELCRQMREVNIRHPNMLWNTEGRTMADEDISSNRSARMLMGQYERELEFSKPGSTLNPVGANNYGAAKSSKVARMPDSREIIFIGQMEQGNTLHEEIKYDFNTADQSSAARNDPGNYIRTTTTTEVPIWHRAVFVIVLEANGTITGSGSDDTDNYPQPSGDFTWSGTYEPAKLNGGHLTLAKTYNAASAVHTGNGRVVTFEGTTSEDHGLIHMQGTWSLAGPCGQEWLYPLTGAGGFSLEEAPILNESELQLVDEMPADGPESEKERSKEEITAWLEKLSVARPDREKLFDTEEAKAYGEEMWRIGHTSGIDKNGYFFKNETGASSKQIAALTENYLWQSNLNIKREAARGMARVMENRKLLTP